MSLGTPKIETIRGGSKAYKAWKKLVQDQQELYDLHDGELAMLIYLSTKDDARDTLDQMEIREMKSEGGLERAWFLLEEAYGAFEDEKFEEAEELYHSFRRTHGMNITKYLSQLKRLKAEYLREDPGSVISEKAFAQRVLNRAGLQRKERHDVFYNAGGAYNSREIERVLRKRCAAIRVDDAKRGPAPPKPLRRPSHHHPRSSSRGRSRSKERSRTPKSLAP